MSLTLPWQRPSRPLAHGVPPDHVRAVTAGDPVDAPGREPTICETRDTDWLRLQTLVRMPAGLDTRALLDLNAAQPGRAGFAPGAGNAVRILCDLPLLPHQTGEDPRIAPAMESIVRAMRALNGGPIGDRHARASLIAGKGVQSVDDRLPTADCRTPIANLCAESGWPCVERAADRWAVELEGTTRFCQAVVTADGPGVRLAVALADWTGIDAICDQALVELLIAAAGVFRVARPGISIEGLRRTALLVAWLPTEDVATELATALSALSVAAASMIGEIEALRDPRIAGEYLAMNARPPIAA
ncbi:MAG TPA: hypothetical protein VKT77_11570 [Chthonomonadaceae bacterium]|nr:hypothetical protein [Chthonomonadaceae bacterium]